MDARATTPAQETIQMGLAFIPSRAIYVATKLGVPDLIDGTPRSAGELAGELNVDAGALSRILRVLVTVGLLSQGDDGRFSLLPRGRTLCRDAPDSVLDFVILNHELPYRAFGNVMHSVRTGKSADVETFGAPIF